MMNVRRKHQSDCRQYLRTRRSSFLHRTARYDAVIERLLKLGLGYVQPEVSEPLLLVDVGAGRNDFQFRLRQLGIGDRLVSVLPVDGAIDGTDLERWAPPRADYFVAIELLEHLEDPARLLSLLIDNARRGVVVTTPNPDVVDVLAIDPTHKMPVSSEDLELLGMTVEPECLFGTTVSSGDDAFPTISSVADTLVAWRDCR